MAADDAEYQLEPGAVAAQKFSITRKGYKKSEVADYLAQISRELRRLEAAIEAERLESNRELTRFDDVSDALATDGDATAGDRNAADVAALADAARAEAAEIIADAKERADELIAEARTDAESVSSVSGKAAEEAEAQLAGQAETVREKLRDEVRKARSAAAEDADAIRRKAEDEAALIRAAAGDGDDSAMILDSERAETIAARILEDSEGRAEEAIAELERQRGDLETRTAALRLVQDSLTDGLSAARAQLSDMVDSLDRIADLSTLDMAAIDATSADLNPADRVVDDGDMAETANTGSGDDDADDGDDVTVYVAGELPAGIADDAESVVDEGIVRLLPATLGAETDAAETGVPARKARTDTADRYDSKPVTAGWDDVVDTPDDEQIDALFDRVVAQRHGDPLARAVTPDDAIEMPGSHEAAGDEAGGEDADGWGYLDSEPEDSDAPAEDDLEVSEDDLSGVSADPEVVTDSVIVEPDATGDETADEPADEPAVTSGSLDEDSPEPSPAAPGDRLTRLRAAFASLSGSDKRDEHDDSGDVPPSSADDVSAESELASESALADRDAGRDDAAEEVADDLAGMAVDANVAVSQRDRAIASAVPTLKRKIKRGLQDVENIVLDAQRADREPEAGESQIAERLYSHLVPAVAEVVASGFRDAAEHVGVATNPADGIDADTYALDVVRASLSGWVEELSIRIDSHPESGAKQVRAARKDAAELAADLAGTAHAAGLLAAGRRLPKVAGYRLVSSSQVGAEDTETHAIDDDAVLTVARDGAAVALVASS